MPPRLTVIHLVRKPLAGTVASTVLKHGTGALNIDGTRIGTADNLNGGAYADEASDRPDGYENWRFKRGTKGNAGRYEQPSGRWPANLILQHESCCKLVGSHFEEFDIMNYLDPTSGNYSFFAECEAERGAVEGRKAGQMVEDWECVEGCPCLDLDGQSGCSTSALRPGDNEYMGTAREGWRFRRAAGGFADTGGASRFFKQVQSVQDLHEYLVTLISPPQTPTSPKAQVWGGWPWAGADNPGSQVGLILHGFVPTPEQAAILYSTLVPGGHICLFAPDEQPTGHRGAIQLEDAGFEIRDALLWVRGPGRLHYVAKAARKEREAGCHKLPAKRGFEAVERKEGSAGVQNPRAGAGRTAEKVRNPHPTVKPIALMVRLLADVPKDQGPVLDPFLGSGTTLIACRQTGHDALGIEREEEYLKVADARVRYWDQVNLGPRQGASIRSDVPQTEEVVEEVPLEDYFN